MFGRLRTVTVAVAVFGVMSLACAFAWDAQSLIAMRFIQGIGLGAEVPVATTYIIELARSQGRGRFYILYELIFVFGLVAAALFGYEWCRTLAGNRCSISAACRRCWRCF